MKENIVLIGMPGAGKSTVGVVLAKRLGLSFLDSDLVIQEREGCILHEIIEVKRTIIATGGSAVYGKEAMQHLHEIGAVFYLKLSYEELKNRLGDLSERGVSIRKGQTLLDLYEERKPLYEKYADYVVDCEGKSIREVVEEMTKLWKKEIKK